jgi:hypothetical protein
LSGEQVWTVLWRSPDVAIYGVDVVLSFSPDAGSVREIRAGADASHFALASRHNQPGVLRAALAGPTPLRGEGRLLSIRFERDVPADLRLAGVAVNDGNVPIEVDSDGSGFDRDRDGLLDMDEARLYGTSPDSADTDGDGAKDGDEVRAGTDPTNARLFLAVTRVAFTADGGTQISWSSVPGKTYAVEYSETLPSHGWTDLGTPVLARGPATTAKDNSPQPRRQRYYRVRLVE